MISLNLTIARHPEEEDRRVDTGRAESPAPAAIPVKVSGAAAETKVLRFYRSERRLHWAIAVPFLVCLAVAAVLVVVYNPDPSRPYRRFFSWMHRISGLALILLPALVARQIRGESWVHFYNIKQAWTWVFDDVKWLALMGLASLSSKVELPEQGKFNAAEKLNFMVLMSTYPFYVATGILMWVTECAFLSWLLHVFMALMAAPLICGHLYMALVSRSGRPGLQGMISGFVDRHWAKHHYRRWYREHHEPEEEGPAAASSIDAETPSDGRLD